MMDGRRRGNRIRFRPSIPLLLIITATAVDAGRGGVAATSAADATDPAATARAIGHITGNVAASHVEVWQLSV